MIYDEFLACFGRPRVGSAEDLHAFGLEHCGGLNRFGQEVGFGSFADGLISIVSQRERGVDLCGWTSWVPAGATLFASTAFGLLYLIDADNTIWVLDPQEGIVVESDLAVDELLLRLTTPTVLNGSMRTPLFARWKDIGQCLPLDFVLSPTPALPLGGCWAVESLRPVSLAVYLAFTSSLFRPLGDTSVEVRRLTR